MELGLVLLLAVKGGVVAASVYPLFRRDRARFAGKAMDVRAVLCPGFTLLIPVAWPAGTPATLFGWQ